VDVFLEFLPWFIAMAVFIALSAFFSSSEAALFYLRPREVRSLSEGGPGQRAAATLLKDPDRLLSAVLFWNLVINVAYFALVSMAALRLEPKIGATGAAVFSFGALLAIIFLSEMLPKSVAVLQARVLAGVVGLPLSWAARAVDPVMPALRSINKLSQRFLWPRFEAEPYMAVADLERAIEISTSDAQLLERERQVLSNIVSLSDIRVDELMRPRTQFRSFRPPVSIDDLEGRPTPSGYLLVTEPDSEEVAAAIQLSRLSDLNRNHLEHQAEPVLYTPWCASVGEALDQLKTRDREVAAIVNEYGETIGILTLDDIIDTIFGGSPSRTDRLLKQRPIQAIGSGRWRVTGMTSVRRLARHFRLSLPASHHVTVAGVLHEVLHDLPEAGDTGRWGPFEFQVVQSPPQGQMLVELQLTEPREDAP